MKKQAPQTSKVMAFMLRLLKQEAEANDGSLAGTYYIRPHQRYAYENGEVSPAFERAYEIAVEIGLIDELIDLIRQAETPVLQQLTKELNL